MTKTRLSLRLENNKQSRFEPIVRFRRRRHDSSRLPRDLPRDFELMGSVGDVFRSHGGATDRHDDDDLRHRSRNHRHHHRDRVGESVDSLSEVRQRCSPLKNTS